MSTTMHTATIDESLRVGDDGWYRQHDYWLSTCGLYEQYRYALGLLGDLNGKQGLDCGCGHGQTSIMLARHGARITAFDVSRDDLGIAERLAKANHVDIEFRMMAFENLDFDAAHFDFVFGACVLHHVDVAAASREIGRVLRPGGRAVFVENSARNPLLMFARRFIVGNMGVPRYGDDHEHPLTRRDIRDMRRAFPGEVRVHFPDFLLFRLLDFYLLRRRSALLSGVLRFMDRCCGKIPVIKGYGYFQVVEFNRS